MVPTSDNLDLFEDPPAPGLVEGYEQALSDWLALVRDEIGQLQHESSVEMYSHMWAGLKEWAIGEGIVVEQLGANDLERYIGSRGGADDLSPRYAWRLLRVVDRILQHRALVHQTAPNPAAKEALARNPELLYANAHNKDPKVQYLAASEAKLLVTYLSAVRPGRGASQQSWQEVRDRASVALMLGAGITPGEIRAMKLEHVIVAGGRGNNVPWKLVVEGNGNSKGRETPLALWAGHVLKHWIEVRAEQKIPKDMLFPSTRTSGKPWGKIAQYNAAKEVLRAAALDDPDGGSFRLRHTFAVRQLRKGKSPAEVAAWLGLTDQSFMRYRGLVASPIDIV